MIMEKHVKSLNEIKEKLEKVEDELDDFYHLELMSGISDMLDTINQLNKRMEKPEKPLHCAIGVDVLRISYLFFEIKRHLYDIGGSCEEDCEDADLPLAMVDVWDLMDEIEYELISISITNPNHPTQ